VTDVHAGHLAGTDFLQQDAIRGAVRQTYRAVHPTDRRVAERFYSPEELVGLPDETVRIALGVSALPPKGDSTTSSSAVPISRSCPSRTRPSTS